MLICAQISLPLPARSHGRRGSSSQRVAPFRRGGRVPPAAVQHPRSIKSNRRVRKETPRNTPSLRLSASSAVHCALVMSCRGALRSVSCFPKYHPWEAMPWAGNFSDYLKFPEISPYMLIGAQFYLPAPLVPRISMGMPAGARGLRVLPRRRARFPPACAIQAQVDQSRKGSRRFARTTLGCASRLNIPPLALSSNLYLLSSIFPRRAAPDKPNTARSGNKTHRILK
jgi:hypothetical protein